MDPRLHRRAHLHAALGDAARLAIVDDLSISDRSPKELADRLGMPTNLLAHHLDVLESADLIRRITSSGDKRRRYVQLVRESLAGLGLGTTPPAASTLFVCTHNSARSQLAAALWRARTRLPAASAGTHPADRVHPGAVEAAARYGLELLDSLPQLLGDTTSVDVVVTVCDRAHEELDPGPAWRHWSIPDPVEIGTKKAFDDVLADLEGRISSLSSTEEQAR